MTPSEVQTIALALRGLTGEVAALSKRFDDAELEAKALRDELTDVQRWRERMKGAWLVFTFAAPTVSALVVAYLTK